VKPQLFRWLFLLLLFGFSFPSMAQGDEPTISPIVYNSTVANTISAVAVFDWWQVQASAGDVMRVQMIGSEGLAPQAAILSPAGDRVAASEEGLVNGVVTLEYTVNEPGQYTLLATRVGETSGSYSLTLQRLHAEAAAGGSEEVVFVCNGEEMALLAAVEFMPEEANAGTYPLYVYGFDGLLPAIRFQSAEQDIDVCHRDAQDQAGDVITLPGAEPVTLAADQLDTASQLSVNAANVELGSTLITFGAVTDGPGRYLAIIGGFSINPTGDTDIVRVRPGALANRDAAMQVYMVGIGPNNRLDPSMRFSATGLGCDDAGRRACTGVPAVDGAGVVFNTGALLVGDRFDAGLSFDVGSLGWQEIELGSFSGSTGGDYALLIVGQMPPRSLESEDESPDS
jgi:hypothetical protein